jgi:hypothetical protein
MPPVYHSKRVIQTIITDGMRLQPTSGLPQAGFASRDKYAEIQTLARVESVLKTPPA